MSENDFIERRRCVRIPIDSEISFTIGNNMDAVYQGKSQNICSNGIYLTTSCAAKLNDSIRIVLDTFDDDIEPLIAEGRIVRCKFDKKNPDLFHISVEFFETHENWIQIFSETTPPSS